MGAIHVHEFMSLDGVAADPSWSFEFFPWDPAMEQALETVTSRCKGILLGRETYEAFEPAWSTRTVEDDPGVPFFNDSPKYVVSTTLTDPTWNNSEVIGGYDPEVIRKLKADVGDLYVSGSVKLVRAMLSDGLVDELHLMIYPTFRGDGLSLFTEGATPRNMTLASCTSYSNDAVYLNYRPKN